MHFDEAENLMAVVKGTKRFTLYPPHISSSLYPLYNTETQLFSSGVVDSCIAWDVNEENDNPDCADSFPSFYPLPARRCRQDVEVLLSLLLIRRESYLIVSSAVALHEYSVIFIYFRSPTVALFDNPLLQCFPLR